MKRAFAFCLVLSVLTCLSGCEREPLSKQSSCDPVAESVYVNERNPSLVESYSPDSLRLLTFETAFKDTVSVLIGNQLLAKNYLETKANGLAGQIKLDARANQEITLQTREACARFKLRDGYKYLYINRLPDKRWEIAYSNYSRGYF